MGLSTLKVTSSILRIVANFASAVSIKEKQEAYCFFYLKQKFDRSTCRLTSSVKFAKTKIHTRMQGCRNPGGMGGYIHPNNLTVSPQ